MPNFKRPSFVDVLGFDEPRWTPTHEKRVVNVLLDLLASGIGSEDKFDLAGLISLPEIVFLNFKPRRQEPEAKRIRVDSP